MEKILVKGDTYTVASKTTCTVTSAAGANLGTAFPGAPLRFTATTGRVTRRLRRDVKAASSDIQH